MNDMMTSGALYFSPVLESYWRIAKSSLDEDGHAFSQVRLARLCKLVPCDDVDVIDGVVLLRSTVGSNLNFVTGDPLCTYQTFGSRTRLPFKIMRL